MRRPVSILFFCFTVLPAGSLVVKAATNLPPIAPVLHLVSSVFEQFSKAQRGL